MSVFALPRIAFAALLAGLALTVTAPARADQLQDIKKAGVVRVAPMEIFLFIGLLYFILCGGLSWAARITARQY